jgi:hypothetical protein
MWRWTRRNPNGYDSPMLESDEESDEAQKWTKYERIRVRVRCIA